MKKEIFKVYHVKDSESWDNASFPDDYIYVADVTATGLDEAFKMTNHIENSWLDNAGVRAYVARARSTNIGDVIVNSNNTAFRCISLGWEKI